MDLEDFRSLDPADQNGLVRNFGIKVGEHIEGVNRYVLYNCFSFYIEKKFNMKYGVLVDIIAFDTTCLILDLYLSNITLPRVGNT
jgi:hypothetical protein